MRDSEIKREYKQIIRLEEVIIFLVVIAILIFISSSFKSDFPEISEKVSDSIVLVKLKDVDGKDYVLGTGFVVDKRGYIITAMHNFDTPSSLYEIPSSVLINDFGYVELFTDLGKEEIKVKQVKNDKLERKDVVLLKLNENINVKNYLKVAEKEEINVAEEVGFAGYTNLPSSLNKGDLFINKAVLSNEGLDIEKQEEKFYSINGIATSGYSGGPVFLSNNGRVIGIVKESGYEQIRNDQKIFSGKTGIVIISPIHEVPKIIEDNERIQN